jgi:hypothetical protein
LTVLERLYKRAAKVRESDELNSAFVLTPNILAPTLEEIAVVQAEVDDDALTRAIETIKLLSDQVVGIGFESLKVQLNKATE